MTKKDIFNFNHIDLNIATEKLKQIQDLYAYYHKVTWIYRHSHKRINCDLHIFPFTWYMLQSFIEQFLK